MRGVALLGILLLNIWSFALPHAAYVNPLAGGGTTPSDMAAWAASFVLFDGRMRGLFALLFGASMVLVAERAEQAGRDPVAANGARMLWLLAFGLAHLWLVWRGDILHHYALVGLLLFGCRDLTTRSLLLLAALLMAGAMLLAGGAVAGATPSDLATLWGVPPRPAVVAEIASHRQSFGTLAAARFASEWSTPVNLLVYAGGETGAFMLIGMAALRSGVTRWPAERLRRWALLGLGLGLATHTLLALAMAHSGFNARPVAWCAFVLARGSAVPGVIGWGCLIVLLARRGGVIAERLAAVGRMAFTNYIATSLICVWLFDGWGLGLFAGLSRAHLLVVVAGVWALILAWSAPWLARFRYGPLEWLWRSLARGERQSFRR